MGKNIQQNAGYSGDVMTYKEQVKKVYPDAECRQHHRRTFFLVTENGETIEMTRYQYDVICNKNKYISASTYSEEGAWEYAWKYIEKEMLTQLES
jgi:hypothetical protein